MKILYKDNDLWDIIKEHILPCLEENLCDLGKHFHRNDMDAMRCIDRTLNKKIISRPLNHCNYIYIAKRNVCRNHCKALPFYKYIRKTMEEHERSADQFIHFNFPKPLCYAIANMFKDQYYENIYSYSDKRLKGCCEKHSFGQKWPAGWRTKMTKKKKDLIRKEYEYNRNHNLPMMRDLNI